MCTVILSQAGFLSKDINHCERANEKHKLHCRLRNAKSRVNAPGSCFSSDRLQRLTILLRQQRFIQAAEEKDAQSVAKQRTPHNNSNNKQGYTDSHGCVVELSDRSNHRARLAASQHLHHTIDQPTIQGYNKY